MFRPLRIFLIIASIMLAKNGFSQNQNDSIAHLKIEVEQLIQEKKYQLALNLIHKFTIEHGNQPSTQILEAMIHFHQMNYNGASALFSEVGIEYLQQNDFEKIYFWAFSARNGGQYKVAIDLFNLYISKGKSGQNRRLSEQEIKSCTYSLLHQNDSLQFQLVHLPSPLNSPYSEFAPVALSDRELVFSRYQGIFDDSLENLFTKTYVSDIYSVNYRQINSQVFRFQKPKLLSVKLSSIQDLTAHTSFNKAKNKCYFSRCQNLDGEIGKCAIYKSSKKNGKWSKPTKLDLGNNDFSYSQPYFYENETSKILIFSSNKEGGFGGFDLWYIQQNGTEWTAPINLGSMINSSGNEISPFFDGDQKMLYFSSDGHAGFGGLDIYKSLQIGSQWSTVVNLGQPINSASNDYSYFHRKEGIEVFLASNRTGSQHLDDAENCCSDIYFAYPLNVKPEFKTLLPTDSTVPIDSIEVSIKSLLPLDLYFDNDQPNPKSTLNTTNAVYEQLFIKYFSERKKYQRHFEKGLSSEELVIAQTAIDSLFDYHILGGFEKVNQVCEMLLQQLEVGMSIKLSIRGYASPLNSPEYNLSLSYRRIQSFINYLRTYQNGVLIQYLDSNENKPSQLKIIELPFGESIVNPKVSDDRKDLRNSVYSPEAALMRKIRIELYEQSKIID